MLKKAREQNKYTLLKAKGTKLVETKKWHMKVIMIAITKQPHATGCVLLAFSC